MFEPFFGFERTPFQRDFPVENCFSTPGFEELVSRLKYAAEKRFFVLATGDVGSGKTTALRKLVTLLNPNRYLVIYISESALTPRNFYWDTLKQLGCAPRFLRSDAKRQLHQVILNLAETDHKIPVVVVDEAHLLCREMLEEFRFLLNFRFDSYNPMSLILVGQPELKRVLQLQVYEAISQRLNLRYHLPPMDREETGCYVVHHLKIAGVTAAIFTEDALDVIFEFAGGISRKVNNICLACLLDAAIKQKRLIDDHMVKVVIANEFSAKPD
jgi:type II secretory pathway predicted ATPase ExeA